MRGKDPINKEEKRKHPRVEISFPVECTFLPKRNYFFTVSKNISRGGVKIFSDEFLPKGSKVKLNLNLISTVISSTAKVAWCSKERTSQRYSAGLEIVEINNENEKELAKLVGKIYNA